MSIAPRLRSPVPLACLLFCIFSAGLAGGRQDRVGGEALPFSVVDLQRRSQALKKAAESLETLLEAWASGRLEDGRFRDYFRERAELLRRLSKDLASDPSLRQLAWLNQGRSKDDDKPEKPPVPTSLAEAVRMSKEIAELAAAVNEQAVEVAGDVRSFEVRVDELAKPDPVALCKRLRVLADRLVESARSGGLSREEKSQ